MAKRTVGKPFKKGQSGNPSGRPALTEKDRIVQKLTRETWNNLSEKIMTCNQQDLMDLIAGGLPYESELFIRHMLKLGESPDWHAYEKYLARRIGPVKQEMDLNVHPKPTVVRLRNGDVLKIGTDQDEEEK